MHTFPSDYPERVYAGVLGKIIGVYLGRPFEGWRYERIMEKLGEIHYYVHDQLGLPLVVTDDDIAGAFTFLRALEDYRCSPHLTAAQIGQTWLNYLVEGCTILWWGGLGNSTEHTAYLRLKNGIPAPRSGSCELNGRVISEQIGAQIFIDGWAMVCPGDPQRAADFARRAASVSHDGEAIYAAQVVAAMQALAFVEPNLDRILDSVLPLIPADCLIYRLINDVREWHARCADWREARRRVEERYGYHIYGGNCHIVPNHALIHLGLLYGEDDFQKSLMITNTCGWDTDCNSANVGCLLGIKNGLSGIDCGPDWRTPVADRLFMSSADGGRCITDAVIEAGKVINLGYALAGAPPWSPKSGARFHFEFPGSLQGFGVEESPQSRGALTLENALGHSRSGQRSLALRCRPVAPGQILRAATPTFILPEELSMPGYTLMASPTLYSGQSLSGSLQADEDNRTAILCGLFLSVYDANDALQSIRGPQKELAPAEIWDFSWRVPDTGGCPIAQVGLELTSPIPAHGSVYLDWLSWKGAPEVLFTRPSVGGAVWRRAWVNGVDQIDDWAPQSYRLIQNSGRGLLIQGCREWHGYRASADITPHLMRAGGLAVHVQGMRRFYALLLCEDHTLRLIKALDGDRLLAAKPFPWQAWQTYQLALEARDGFLRAFCDGEIAFEVSDDSDPLLGGAVALVCEEGCFSTQAVCVSPLDR